MSISTPSGDQRRPSVVSTGKKPPAGRKPSGDKPAAGGTPAGETTTAEGGRTATETTGAKPGPSAKPGISAKPAAAKPSAGRAGGGGKSAPGARAGGGGKGPRKPVKAVRVSQERAWGPIALFVAVGVLAVGIVGYGAFAVYQGARSWEDRASDISGISNFRESDPQLMGGGQHKSGPIEYTASPPVAGEHNATWQNCMGDVYDAPIASEHAVHSLEHGAVWITYRPDLAADQVETLAGKVRGTEKLFMSPYEGLDSAVSLQAWGYQLKVDDASDGRIDEFIQTLRVNASVEGPTALCSRGVTATGTAPREIQQQQQQQ